MSANLLGKCADICQKISTNLSCNICRIFERADICHLISCPWRHQWQRWYEKTSVPHVCKLKRIPALLLLLSRSLSLSVYFIPSLPVASSNKGLTGRAWRSWLLGGKGESHSWVGQASTPAKVMSCVHWEGGIGGMGSYLTQMFFFFFMATWFGEGKAPGPFDEVQGVSKTEGWWLWASQEVEILSKRCVFVYASSSNIPGGVHTCCFFSSIWASVSKVAKSKLWNMPKHSQSSSFLIRLWLFWILFVLYWNSLLLALYWKCWRFCYATILYKADVRSLSIKLIS